MPRISLFLIVSLSPAKVQKAENEPKYVWMYPKLCAKPKLQIHENPTAAG